MPGGVECLHQPQHAIDFVRVRGDFGQQRGGDVFERIGDVAVVVDRIDNRARDRELARREIGVFELADQMVLQRKGGVVGDFGGTLVVIAPGIRSGAALAPVVFDDFGFDDDFRCRLRIHALFFRHRMRFERLERAGGFVFVHGLEHDVAFELLADVRLQLQRRHLQEADRLLQLWGHRQRLTQLQLQRWLHHRHGLGCLNAMKEIVFPAFALERYMRKDWPKYTSRTWGLARISSGVPEAITVPPETT